MLVILLAAPRIARFFYPYANLEDAPYLDVIACLSRGMRPHVDFIHTHFVFPEIVPAIIYSMFTATYRITEAFTAMTVFGTSILVYLLGRDLSSRRIGVVASLLFAWHPIFFVYHVFEKEIYEAFFACLLALVIWRGAGLKGRTILAVAFICFLGFISKLDFSFQAAFVCLYILAVRRRPGAAFAVGVIFLFMVLALSALLAWIYGGEFIRQVYLFHFFKGYESNWWAKFFKWAQTAGYLLVLGLGSIPFAGRLDRDKMLYIAFWIAGPALFFLVVTDTFWAHNIITLLAPLSLLGAVFIDECVKWFAYLFRGGSDESIGLRHGIFIPMFLVFLIFSSYFYFRFASMLHFGFSGAPRAEISAVSKAVREHSRPGDTVIAPAIIAAESDRTDIVHNREVYPVYVWAMDRMGKVGFVAARREALNTQFRKLYDETKGRWLKGAMDNIQSRSVAVVVGDLKPGYQGFYPDPGLVAQAGYKVVYKSPKYIVWALN